MSGDKQPAAGWYDDPTMVNTRRYWDGTQWTQHRQEMPAPAARAPVPAVVEEKPSNWINAAYLFAFLLPVVGLIIGIARIRAEPKWAWKAITMSLVFAAIYTVLYLKNVA